jgi:hypothetical protein
MHTMALDQSALLELLDVLKAADADDVVRHAVEAMFQVLIDAEATAVIGAGPHERTPARVTQRNGYRDRLLTMAAGDLELRIPKLRTGSFFPSLLERRRRIDQALFAVVMEAYVTGTSTRKVDDLVRAIGADSGISRSEVSRICADLDVEVAAFRDRSLAGMAFPYVFLDATPKSGCSAGGRAFTPADRRWPSSSPDRKRRGHEIGNPQRQHVVDAGQHRGLAGGQAGGDGTRALDHHGVIFFADQDRHRHADRVQPVEDGWPGLHQVALLGVRRGGAAQLLLDRWVVVVGRPGTSRQRDQSLTVTRTQEGVKLRKVPIVLRPRIVRHTWGEQHKRRHPLRFGYSQTQRRTAASTVPDHDRSRHGEMI